MRGYLYIESEQYGFDEEMYVIIQPKGQFFDFSIENPVNDITKVYKGYFGRKFLIPAEFDVLIYFAPIKYNSKKQATLNGKFRFRTIHQIAPTFEQLEDENLEIIERPVPIIDEPIEEETTPPDEGTVPTDEETTQPEGEGESDGGDTTIPPEEEQP